MMKPKKLKIFIAEDSQENVETIMILLGQMELEFEVSHIAKTLVEADNYLRAESFDLAFLDIQFKEGTIFEVLEKFNLEQIVLPEIVFVTAHGSFEYATQAIKYACLDFINKPIQPAQLQQAIDKSLQKESKVERQRQLKLLIELLEEDSVSPEKIAVVLPKNALEFIQMQDLLYIEADGSTSVFYLEEKTFRSTRALGYYIELFQDNPTIVQISRSCIVNKDKVDKYQFRTRALQLQNGKTLVASVRMNKQINEKLKKKSGSSIGTLIEKVKKLLD